MNEQIFKSNTYSVAFAERRTIGDEWNHVCWDRNHHQIQYHRLYFLTSGEATIHLVDGSLHLLPGNVYFIPAFSVLQSEINGEMNKYYIHFQADSPLLSLYRYLSGRYCAKANEITKHLFDTVVDHYAKSTQDSYLKVQGAMDLLLSDFFAGLDLNRHDLLKFEPVMRYIDEHYCENITISTLTVCYIYFTIANIIIFIISNTSTTSRT